MEKIAWDISSAKLRKNEIAQTLAALAPLRAPSADSSSPSGTKIAKLPYKFTELCPVPAFNALVISCIGIRFPCLILIRMRAGSWKLIFNCSVI